ncbi:hypothetical protein BASA81_006236 [Batrachochytrium salamandrivorans]|nr:hypothetical protein BASA81_006236 [Batrachochytrium salamandrivorans]
MEQSDPALEAFERLRVREARARYGDTASTFLTKFQSIAASLEPDGRIKLMVVDTREPNMELLKAVLADPQANKICSLRWSYDGEEDVNSIIPLLVTNCPKLASLDVCFRHYSAFDFASSVLEHPSNKVKVLEVPTDIMGDIPRFFAALRQSQVSALTLSIGESPEVAQGLFEYLAKDLLVRLNVRVGNEQILNVRELDLFWVSGVNANQLGGALAAHLRAKGLDELRFYDCDFVDETLAVVGVEVGRIKRLEIYSDLSNASIALIALALQSPNSEMQELKLKYESSIKNHLVPALKHPNCNLVRLSLLAYEPEHEEAAERMEDMFHNRLALFVLLQGKRAKRRYCPLRRLPVEMFRLVGQVLL